MRPVDPTKNLSNCILYKTPCEQTTSFFEALLISFFESIAMLALFVIELLQGK